MSSLKPIVPKNCKKCPSLVKSRIQMVEGQGNKNAVIMFVGICPGNHLLHGGADSTGIPFKGDKSGDIFERLLHDLQTNRKRVYVTNLVKCRPATEDKMYNRPPTQKEIMNCLPNLIKEIKKVKPWIIICFGSIVYDTLEPELKKRKINIYTRYCWHPAFIARSPDKYNIWKYDIQSKIRFFVGNTASYYNESGDKLDKLFKMQFILQDRLGFSNPEDLQNYINLMVLGVLEELGECLHETKWKPWKKTATYNENNFQKEVIDLWHFVINLTIASGMDANKLFEKFSEKNKINHRRQENGY